MNREWQIRRTVAEYTDGQRRWDTVYQLLLSWMMEQQSTEILSQEKDHEDRHLCSSIDQSSNANANH